ncbi:MULTISPECIES: hypothetical protein [unclassified Halomonas]|nr:MULTISPECIES: hypothetical protein [unclassified Halomonas]
MNQKFMMHQKDGAEESSEFFTWCEEWAPNQPLTTDMESINGA